MDLAIADQVPFEPWYFTLLSYAALVYLVLAVIAIRLFFAFRAGRDPIRHQLMYGNLKGLLWLFFPVSAAFFIALSCSIAGRFSIASQYHEWALVRTEYSWFTMAISIICLSIAISLLLWMRLKKRPPSLTQESKTGAFIVLAFGAVLVGLPFLWVYIAGASYNKQKNLIYASWTLGVVLLILGSARKSVIAASLFRWASLASFLIMLLVPVTQSLMTQYWLPGTMVYCQEVIRSLDAEVQQAGAYPDKLPSPPIHGKSIPLLVRQTGQWFYEREKTGSAFYLHLWQDSGLSFTYSSETKKWSAWRSNLW